MNKKREKNRETALPAANVSINVATSGKIEVQNITDKNTLSRNRVFKEAIKQCKPIIRKSEIGTSKHRRAVNVVKQGTARKVGLHSSTCSDQLTKTRCLEKLISGTNAKGKTAEIVFISDYRELHSKKNPGIVNSPNRIAQNVRDIRLAPDDSSRKDILVEFQDKNGKSIFKYNGQVKTGTAKYVADSLVEMANKPGYGKVAYVDSKFVNSDGTARVAKNAFTRAQAEKLQKAKVILRGIPNLESRSKNNIIDIKKYERDKLSPVERKQLKLYREDISNAYNVENVTYRTVSSAAVGAGTAAIVSLVISCTLDEEVDFEKIGKSAVSGAVYGTGTTLIESGIFHASMLQGAKPEDAQLVAQQGTAGLFCLLSLGLDAYAEFNLANNGEITKSGAVAGFASKAVLDILPFALAPLGTIGIPILIGSQVGGRWAISKIRECEQKHEVRINEDMAIATEMSIKLKQIGDEINVINAECDETDRLFVEAMSG